MTLRMSTVHLVKPLLWVLKLFTGVCWQGSLEHLIEKSLPPVSTDITAGTGTSLTAHAIGWNQHICHSCIVLLIDVTRMIYWLSVRCLFFFLFHCDTHTLSNTQTCTLMISTHTHTHTPSVCVHHGWLCDCYWWPRVFSWGYCISSHQFTTAEAETFSIQTAIPSITCIWWTHGVCAHTKVRAHTPLLLAPCAHLPHLRQCTDSPAITPLTVSCGWLLVQAGCSCRVRGEHLSWQRSYLEKRLRVMGGGMINGAVLLGLNSVWLFEFACIIKKLPHPKTFPSDGPLWSSFS